MKKLIPLVAVLLAIIAMPAIGKGGGGGGTVSVNGYTRSNGTVVAPYTRSAPGSGGGSASFDASSTLNSMPSDVGGIEGQIQQDFNDKRSAVQSKIDLEEVHHGKNSPALAKWLTALGTLHLKHGTYAEAETAYNRALVIIQSDVKDASPAKSEDLARIQCALGELYYLRGEYPKAEEALKPVIDLEPSPFKDKGELAYALQIYAKVLYKTGKEADANAIYARIKTLK